MAIAKWFVKDSRPANMVEDEGFVRFMEQAQPQYIVPSRWTITSYIEKLYVEVKEKVKDELKKIEFVAKSTDGGSSSNASSFQETGVHGITDDFQMKYFTLAVKECKDEHTAENYRKNTDKVEEEFEVKDKVVMTTTDNEAKMRKAYKDHERTGCMSHIIHSSVEVGTTKDEVVNKTILKHRKIARKHNKSYVVKYNLQKAQQKLRIKVRPLLQDVVNRWGSTRVSTESMLDHKDDQIQGEKPASAVFGSELDGFKNAQAINEAMRKHKFSNKEKMQDYILTGQDMTRIQNLNNFLTKFDLYSTTLGGNKFVSASLVMPTLKSIQKHLQPSENDTSYIANMKRLILNDFVERTAKNVNYEFLIKASALDPRFKKLKFVEDKAKRVLVFKKLEDEADEDKKKKDGAKAAEKVSEGDLTEDEHIEKKRKLGLEYDESEDEEADELEDVIKREIEGYKAEPDVPKDEEDIMSWWRENKIKYPNLARLAR